MADKPLTGKRSAFFATDGRGAALTMLFRRKSDRSSSAVRLVRGLVSDAVRLLRVEVDLVKARFSGMLRKAGIGAGLLAELEALSAKLDPRQRALETAAER